MLHLQEYTPQHNRALSYALEAHQAVFTALPEIWFASGGNADVLPASIIADGLAVGFFVLDKGADKAPYTDNENALLLRSMSVNPEFQGKGYAQAALTHPDFARLARKLRADAGEVVLGVNVLNQGAARCYERSGFADTGRRYQGEQGEQIIMSRPLPFQAA